MQQLQFLDLDEGGRLVLSDDDGMRYALVVDDRLRAALRPRPMTPTPDHTGVTVGPRDVQAMIRAGQSAEEVAASTGWELARVQRFEGPVIAERQHVVALAQRAPVRVQGRTDGSTTLDQRVKERLQGRGVEMTSVSWDSSRSEAHGPWTVLAIFSAGGRERRAAWHYDQQTRAIHALDDEARWLSEDEQSLPGGLEGHPLLGQHADDEMAADLMETMRQRRQRRGRGRRKELGSEDPSHVPGQQMMPEEVLPLEDLAYDPDTMGDPPAAHPRVEDHARPTPEAGEDEQESAEKDSSEQDSEKDDATGTGTGDGAAPAEEETSSTEEEKKPARKERRAKRQRRRLRMPKLPEPVGEPVVEDSPEPEGTFARMHHQDDPQEVSFDEFFGTEEGAEDDEVDENEASFTILGPDDPEPEAASDPVEPGPDATESLPVVRPVEDPEDEDGPENDSEDAPEADAEVDGAETAVADSEDLEDLETDEAAAEDRDEESSDADSSDEEDSDAQPPAEESAPKPKPSGRKGRTSVPSWDDIMFGSRDQR